MLVVTAATVVVLVAVELLTVEVVDGLAELVVLVVVVGGVLLVLGIVEDALEVVVELLRGHVPGARSVRRVGVGVFGTLVLGAVPTVMVALPLQY